MGLFDWLVNRLRGYQQMPQQPQAAQNPLHQPLLGQQAAQQMQQDNAFVDAMAAGNPALAARPAPQAPLPGLFADPGANAGGAQGFAQGVADLQARAAMDPMDLLRNVAQQQPQNPQAQAVAAPQQVNNNAAGPAQPVAPPNIQNQALPNGIVRDANGRLVQNFTQNQVNAPQNPAFGAVGNTAPAGLQQQIADRRREEMNRGANWGGQIMTDVVAPGLAQFGLNAAMGALTGNMTSAIGNGLFGIAQNAADFAGRKIQAQDPNSSARRVIGTTLQQAPGAFKQASGTAFARGGDAGDAFQQGAGALAHVAMSNAAGAATKGRINGEVIDNTLMGGTQTAYGLGQMADAAAGYQSPQARNVDAYIRDERSAQARAAMPDTRGTNLPQVNTNPGAGAVPAPDQGDQAGVPPAPPAPNPYYSERRVDQRGVATHLKNAGRGFGLNRPLRPQTKQQQRVIEAARGPVPQSSFYPSMFPGQPPVVLSGPEAQTTGFPNFQAATEAAGPGMRSTGPAFSHENYPGYAAFSGNAGRAKDLIRTDRPADEQNMVQAHAQEVADLKRRQDAEAAAREMQQAEEWARGEHQRMSAARAADEAQANAAQATLQGARGPEISASRAESRAQGVMNTQRGSQAAVSAPEDAGARARRRQIKEASIAARQPEPSRAERARQQARINKDRLRSEVSAAEKQQRRADNDMARMRQARYKATPGETNVALKRIDDTRKALEELQARQAKAKEEGIDYRGKVEHWKRELRKAQIKDQKATQELKDRIAAATETIAKDTEWTQDEEIAYRELLADMGQRHHLDVTGLEQKIMELEEEKASVGMEAFGIQQGVFSQENPIELATQLEVKQLYEARPEVATLVKDFDKADIRTVDQDDLKRQTEAQLEVMEARTRASLKKQLDEQDAAKEIESRTKGKALSLKDHTPQPADQTDAQRISLDTDEALAQAKDLGGEIQNAAKRVIDQMRAAGAIKNANERGQALARANENLDDLKRLLADRDPDLLNAIQTEFDILDNPMDFTEELKTKSKKRSEDKREQFRAKEAGHLERLRAVAVPESGDEITDRQSEIREAERWVGASRHALHKFHRKAQQDLSSKIESKDKEAIDYVNRQARFLSTVEAALNRLRSGHNIAFDIRDLKRQRSAMPTELVDTFIDALEHESRARFPKGEQLEYKGFDFGGYYGAERARHLAEAEAQGAVKTEGQNELKKAEDLALANSKAEVAALEAQQKASAEADKRRAAEAAVEEEARKKRIEDEKKQNLEENEEPIPDGEEPLKKYTLDEVKAREATEKAAEAKASGKPAEEKAPPAETQPPAKRPRLGFSGSMTDFEKSPEDAQAERESREATQAEKKEKAQPAEEKAPPAETQPPAEEEEPASEVTEQKKAMIEKYKRKQRLEAEKKRLAEEEARAKERAEGPQVERPKETKLDRKKREFKENREALEAERLVRQIEEANSIAEARTNERSRMKLVDKKDFAESPQAVAERRRKKAEAVAQAALGRAPEPPAASQADVVKALSPEAGAPEPPGQPTAPPVSAPEKRYVDAEVDAATHAPEDEAKIKAKMEARGQGRFGGMLTTEKLNELMERNKGRTSKEKPNLGMSTSEPVSVEPEVKESQAQEQRPEEKKLTPQERRLQRPKADPKRLASELRIKAARRAVPGSTNFIPAFKEARTTTDEDVLRESDESLESLTPVIDAFRMTFNEYAGTRSKMDFEHALRQAREIADPNTKITLQEFNTKAKQAINAFLDHHAVMKDQEIQGLLRRQSELQQAQLAHGDDEREKLGKASREYLDKTYPAEGTTELFAKKPELAADPTNPITTYMPKFTPLPEAEVAKLTDEDRAAYEYRKKAAENRPTMVSALTQAQLREMGKTGAFPEGAEQPTVDLAKEKARAQASIALQEALEHPEDTSALREASDQLMDQMEADNKARLGDEYKAPEKREGENDEDFRRRRLTESIGSIHMPTTPELKFPKGMDKPEGETHEERMESLKKSMGEGIAEQEASQIILRNPQMPLAIYHQKHVPGFLEEVKEGSDAAHMNPDNWIQEQPDAWFRRYSQRTDWDNPKFSRVDDQVDDEDKFRTGEDILGAIDRVAGNLPFTDADAKIRGQSASMRAWTRGTRGEWKTTWEPGRQYLYGRTPTGVNTRGQITYTHNRDVYIPTVYGPLFIGTLGTKPNAEYIESLKEWARAQIPSEDNTSPMEPGEAQQYYERFPARYRGWYNRY
jgi:hypothetical protein